MNTTPKRCLLITPLTFYSFHKSIAAELEKRGYQVELVNEEYPANALGKILGKTGGLKLLRVLTLRGLKRRISGRYDLVLIIKGRGLGKNSIRFLRKISDRIVGYNVDSFLFNPSPLDWYSDVDRYATFDIRDAQKYSIPLTHLYSATLPEYVSNERPFDLSVIMRLHSQRLAYLDRVLAALPCISQYIFLYESSYITLILGFLKTPRLYAKYWRYISFSPLSYEQAMKALGQSRMTLDYAHPLQSGITVRCFEAQSLGVRLITNNQQVQDSGTFDRESVVSFPIDGNTKKLKEEFEKAMSNKISGRIRTLSNFLDELIGKK